VQWPCGSMAIIPTPPRPSVPFTLALRILEAEQDK
jgi:hypothetical protein